MVNYIVIFWLITAIIVFILSRPHEIFFGIITIIMFTGFSTVFTLLILEDIIIPFRNLQKKQNKSPGNMPLLLLKSGGIILLITGMASFGNGFFAAAGKIGRASCRERV